VGQGGHCSVAPKARFARRTGPGKAIAFGFPGLVVAGTNEQKKFLLLFSKRSLSLLF
jgi:hypothetical protein